MIMNLVNGVSGRADWILTSRFGRLATALLSVVVLCLLTTVLEIGTATEAEAAGNINCCPANSDYSPNSQGGGGFCVSVDPNTGVISQTPAPSACNVAFNSETPETQAAWTAEYHEWFQEQEWAVYENYVNQQLTNFFGFVPDYSFLVIAAHAGMKQTFVENNYVGGGFLGSSLHDNGGIITTGGATTPGISSTTANLGFEFHDVYDASQALSLGPDRQLLLAGYFFYNNEYSSFGAVGNVRSDDYTFIGAAAYRQGGFYTIGQIGGGFSPSNFTNGATGATGSATSGGFLSDVKIGYQFLLLDPRRAGWALGLDLSGHGGYLDNTLGGFTSAGTAIGNTQAQSGLVGAEAKLQAAMPGGGLLWSPYIGATFDDWVGFHDATNIPGGGVITLQEGEQFWGGEAGLGVTWPNGVNLKASGFYKASSTTNFSGGTLALNVPWAAFAGSSGAPILVK